MYTSRTIRSAAIIGITCCVTITACGSDPATTAGSAAPVAGDAGAPAESAPPPTGVRASVPTTASPPPSISASTTTSPGVTMEEFRRSVADECDPAVDLLASLPEIDGSVETVQAQIAMIRAHGGGLLDIDRFAVPAALRPQMDELAEFDAATGAVLDESDAAAAAGDGALASEHMERYLERSKIIAVRFAMMGASCGPVEADRAATAALNVPVEGNP